MKTRVPSTLFCEETPSGNQLIASSLGLSLGQLQNCCGKQKREMSLETYTTGRKSVEIDPATKTREYFGELEGPKEDNARMG